MNSNLVVLLLGFADLIASLTVLLRAFWYEIPVVLVILVFIYLLVKFFAFKINLAGFIDLGGALVLLASLFFTLPIWPFIVFAILILLKAFKSIIA